MESDMDFDAGEVLSGICSQQELAQELAGMVVEVASGKLTKSEALGHKEYFIPYKFQEKEVVLRACEQ
jgi:altronate hydrolase